MKKLLLPVLFLYSVTTLAQTNADLKNDVNQIKTDLDNVRQQVQAVTTQNNYLKKALDVNAPVLEQTQNDSLYRITSVLGSKKDKTITITFLLESKDQNKMASFSDLTLIDLEGNAFEFDHNRSSNLYAKLTLNVPLKLKFIFKTNNEAPKVVKLFKFIARNEPEGNPLNFNRSNLEFRDLNVSWE
ncbi:hypothetical protein SAMN05660493_02956 [Epilithonimonas bovis DSM 19482]|uniref:Transposase n=1 Tax=Epilithonimonas bovis DSM 19482 TaxID=1121284 RepID=A0A1U7Q177_9FLAO|nr:hypothetical protein [Epilithonimonas bovis]SIT98218.1 hypothetical protein SAMN05660493_02956 [Epilithonimonas bovis DSM 19482]